VANIADINNPVITRNYLPTDIYTGDSYLNRLDTSGDWLVACGYYLGTNGVFGIRNYRNSSSTNWSYSMLSEISGGKGTTVRVDEPFAVWVENNRVYPSKVVENTVGTKNSGPLSGSINLMGAVLFSNGRTNTSVLKSIDDPNWTLNSAVISGDKVVWGADFYYYDSELGTSESYSDLFDSTIQIECGDRGYSLADFNHDCKVDFVDFATFANRWLDCTMPEDENCIDGETFYTGD
jgi:hypothetical protein